MGLMSISSFSEELSTISTEPVEKSLSRELLNELQEKIRLLGDMLQTAQSLQTKQVADLTGLAQKVTPSVVRVETTGGYQTIFDSGSGHGSGCIITPDGYIVTNHHVIDGARKINVVFNTSGLKLPARLVGSDPETDLAVLKIEAEEDLPYSRFVDSDQVQIGSSSVLVGNPLFFSDLLTLGVVGGKVSHLNSGYYGTYDDWEAGLFADYLLSDSLANPGNSGGPLFNIQADIIGICARGATGPGGGITMKITSNTASRVTAELIQNGYITRASLGADIACVRNPLVPYLVSLLPQKSIDLWEQHPGEGLFIAETLKDSPAEKAGLRKGDFFIRYNDIEVTTRPQFFADLSMRIDPYSDLKLTLIRDGEIIDVIVPLGKREVNKVTNICKLGINVETMEGEKYFTYEYDSSIEGVFVTSIARKSEAFFEGLRSTDVITGVILDGQEVQVKNVEELVKLMTEAEGEHKCVLVVRAHNQSRPFYVRSDIC